MSDIFNNEFDQNSLADWQNLANSSLRNQSLAELAHATASGLTFEPLYTNRPAITNATPAAPMQRWDNRLDVIGESVQIQNQNTLNGLQGGVDSLQITLDCPERPSAIASSELTTLLNDVQLDIIPVSLFAGSQFIQAANELEAVWSKQRIASEKASGAFNADPVGTLASTGVLANELDACLKDMTTLAQKTSTTWPNVRSVGVNSVCYHNAGATTEQELVSAISTGALYLQALLDSGLDAQQANDSMVFHMACDADAMANIVKLRALKQLWRHVALRMDVPTPHMQLVVETSKRMLSTRSPWVNHLRNVSAATAAAMGDAQCIVVHPHNRIDNDFIDEQIELSARVARNIPIILSDESSLTFVHDPMAGSYAVETLTANLIKDSWASLQQLETDGGLVNAITTGSWQAAIAEAQQSRINRLRQEQDIAVGVNKYNPTSSAHSDSQKQTSVSQNNAAADNTTQPSDAMAEQVKPFNTVRDALTFEV